MTLDLVYLLEILSISELDLKRYALRSDRYYREFETQKKSGGKRKILAPSCELKSIQRQIVKHILKDEKLHESCTGYRKGHSIVSNAEPHVAKDFVLNMDLKDFFPSISFNRVFGIFQSIGFERNAALLLTRLTTYEKRLPQGAPTSPYIANLVSRKLDQRLDAYSKARGWAYTRYCDDITISGAGSLGRAQDTIREIIESEGFVINERKTRLRLKHQQQSVTGLVVNESVHIPREQRRQLRAVCHQLRKDPESYRGASDRVLGQLSFAHMVEGLLLRDNFREALAELLNKRRNALISGSHY